MSNNAQATDTKSGEIVVITMEGGVIQGVFSNVKTLAAIVVDYDVEELDQADLMEIVDNGDAYVFSEAVVDTGQLHESVADAVNRWSGRPVL